MLVEKPPFTLKDIRAAIPAHCWERSLFVSFRYLAMDLAGVASLLFFASHIDTLGLYSRGLLGMLAHQALWVCYWFWMGAVLTGIWMLGHECGHGGFSPYEWVNDLVGFFAHSFLITPYFSWKISHRRHHSKTGNLDFDEVFVPPVEPNATKKHDDEPSPHEHTTASLFRSLNALYRMAVYLTIGWPIYLTLNVSGHNSYPKGSWVNHFHPKSPIFVGKGEDRLVLLSDIGLIGAIYFYSQVIKAISFWTFVKFLFIPYLVMNASIVVITYLHHTDSASPHYQDSEWDWLRGALTTIDRDFGILNHFHHHISDTHVVHHLFSEIPFYHAEEATKAIIPVLGSYYRCDKTPVLLKLFRNFRDCNVAVRDEKKPGVYWYQ